MANTATANQYQTIGALLAERTVPAATAESMRDLWRAGAMTDQIADTLIKTLLVAPINLDAFNARRAMVGAHTLNGHTFVLKVSANTGMMYVKLVSLTAEGKYALTAVDAAVIKHLSAETKLSAAAETRLMTTLRLHKAIR